MSPIGILLLAGVLAIDAFSVGAVVGMSACSRRQVFRLSFHFGLFQALLPLAGALAGHLLNRLVSTWGPWVAFGLLVAIGLKMIATSLRSRPAGAVCSSGDPTRGWQLVGLSLAVSIDAFGAGVSMGLVLGFGQLAWAVVVIGLVAALGTWLAMRLGRVIVGRLGPRLQAFGGLVLVLLGVRMLWA